jgi:PadR family transcriptional regulator
MPATVLSYAATTVLQAAAGGYQYGFDIIGVTGLPGGTVYPILRRLEDAGYLASRWEKHATAQEQQRPPRKYYELTKTGEQALAGALDRFPLLQASKRKRPPSPRTSSA